MPHLRLDTLLAAVTIVLGAIGMYPLLPGSHGIAKPRQTRQAGYGLIALSLILLATFWTPPGDYLAGAFFYAFSLAALLSGVLTVTSRDPSGVKNTAQAGPAVRIEGPTGSPVWASSSRTSARPSGPGTDARASHRPSGLSRLASNPPNCRPNARSAGFWRSRTAQTCAAPVRVSADRALRCDSAVRNSPSSAAAASAWTTRWACRIGSIGPSQWP